MSWGLTEYRSSTLYGSYVSLYADMNVRTVLLIVCDLVSAKNQGQSRRLHARAKKRVMESFSVLGW